MNNLTKLNFTKDNKLIEADLIALHKAIMENKALKSLATACGYNLVKEFNDTVSKKLGLCFPKNSSAIEEASKLSYEDFKKNVEDHLKKQANSRKRLKELPVRAEVEDITPELSNYKKLKTRMTFLEMLFLSDKDIQDINNRVARIGDISEESSSEDESNKNKTITIKLAKDNKSNRQINFFSEALTKNNIYDNAIHEKKRKGGFEVNITNNSFTLKNK